MAPRARLTRRALLLAACVAGAAGGARAQTRAAVPIQATRAPLDSARQRYHSTLAALRDSLAAVREGAEQFQRDLASVSPETVVSWANVLRGQCAAAIRALSAAEPVFDPARAPAKSPKTRAAAGNLLHEVGALRAALNEDCERGFAKSGPGKWADSLRAWAGFRSNRIEQALSRYDNAAGSFLNAAGFALEPSVRRR